MSKASVIDGDGEKRVHYEVSYVGYVTSYDEVALPNYLVDLQSQNDSIVDIDMEKELNERRNGGYLDDYGDNARYFDVIRREVKLEGLHVLLVDDGIEKADEKGLNYGLIHVRDTMEPDEVNIPNIPDDWVEPDLITERGGGG